MPSHTSRLLLEALLRAFWLAPRFDPSLASASKEILSLALSCQLAMKAGTFLPQAVRCLRAWQPLLFRPVAATSALTRSSLSQTHAEPTGFSPSPGSLFPSQPSVSQFPQLFSQDRLLKPPETFGVPHVALSALSATPAIHRPYLTGLELLQLKK